MQKVILIFSVVVIAVIYLIDFPKKDITTESISDSNSGITTKSQITIKSSFKKSSPEEAPAIHCDQREQLNKKLFDIKTHKSEMLNVFAKFAQKANISKEQQERIIQQANISLNEFRQITAWHEKVDYTDLLPVKGKPEALEGNIASDYYSAMVSKNYTYIIDQANQKLLSRQSIFGGISILTHTILYSQQAGKIIDTVQVEQLMNAGLKPRFADLVALTRENIPLPLLEVVNAYTTENIKQSWYHHYRENTLTMLAANNLNLQHFQYWISQGVPTSTSEVDYSAMDMLKTRVSSQELPQATQIFIDLATQGVKPYDVNTLKTIKKWLPPQVQQEFADYFSEHSKVELSDIESKLSQDMLVRLSQTNKALSDLKEELQHCSKSPLTEVNSITSKLDVKSYAPVIPEATKQNTDEAMQEIAQNFTSALFSATTNNDWTNFLAATDELINDSGTSEMLDIALIQAIQNNAPFIIIQNLIQRGAVLSPHTITVLTIKNNLTLAKKLVPYGLQFHFKSKNNYNALYYAVTYKTSVDMLYYLLNQGVKIAPSVDLLTPLLSENYSIRVEKYLKALIDFDHKVTPEHRVAYMKLSDSNPKLFKALNGYF
ncbi:hypothetical protein AADZ91_11990 [Colwelliaceae bacterium 6441]